jgi:hypothetical protein
VAERIERLQELVAGTAHASADPGRLCQSHSDPSAPAGSEAPAGQGGSGAPGGVAAGDAG